MAIWLAANWIDLVQTAGVVGSLYFAGFALRLDTKVRRTEVLLSLTGSHREIWERLIGRNVLSRVLDHEVDLRSNPPTQAEQEFVRLVILHLATVRQAVKEGAFDGSPGMDDDIREFLSLPIPRTVAKSLIRFQTADFQDYLRRLMG